MSDLQNLYTETCSALRHYSSCILQIRVLVMAQVLVVFSGAAYTLKSENPAFFYTVVTFGIVLTLVLLWQQRNYLGDFETHLKMVTELEEALEGNSTKGSWGEYAKRHEYLREGKLVFRLAVESGPYILFVICFVLLAILKMLGVLTGFVA